MRSGRRTCGSGRRRRCLTGGRGVRWAWRAWASPQAWGRQPPTRTNGPTSRRGRSCQRLGITGRSTSRTTPAYAGMVGEVGNLGLTRTNSRDAVGSPHPLLRILRTFCGLRAANEAPCRPDRRGDVARRHDRHRRVRQVGRAVGARAGDADEWVRRTHLRVRFPHARRHPRRSYPKRRGCPTVFALVPLRGVRARTPGVLRVTSPSRASSHVTLTSLTSMPRGQTAGSPSTAHVFPSILTCSVACGT